MSLHGKTCGLCRSDHVLTLAFLRSGRRRFTAHGRHIPSTTIFLRISSSSARQCVGRRPGGKVAGPTRLRDATIAHPSGRPTTLQGHRIASSRSRHRRTMPAPPLSHQALILPLTLPWPAQFSGMALNLGGMPPDLEYSGQMPDDWLLSHTVSARIWFAIPVSALLVRVTSARLIPFGGLSRGCRCCGRPSPSRVDSTAS